MYSAELVRRIDGNVIAIQFCINEALAVRLAVRIAVAFYEQQNSIGDGCELEEIEVLPVESVECPSSLKLGHYFVPVRGDYDGSETLFR